MRHAAAVLLCAAALQGGEGCLDPESVWKLKSVADPQLSPDGYSVAYVYSWPDRNADTFYSNIRVHTKGEDLAMTEGDYRDGTPRWSPDGHHMAYVSDRGGKRRIHVYAIASRQNRVLDGTDGAAHLAWSPDERWIAYFSFVVSPPDWHPSVPAPPREGNGQHPRSPSPA